MRYDRHLLSRRGLRESAHLHEDLVQLPAGGELQNQVDAFLVEEISIHAQNVLVSMLRYKYAIHITYYAISMLSIRWEGT